MQEINVSSLSQYIEAIERLKSHYPAGPLLSRPTVNQFVYRGLCEEKYTLLPGVFRTQEDDTGETCVKNYKYLSWSRERDLLYSFIHEASGILKIPPDDVLRWTEYAQHYGVPTRFLDWSSNPLVALHFACQSKAKSDAAVWLLHKINYKTFLERNTKTQGGKKLREIISGMINGTANIKYPVLYTPYYVESRMSAQGSYFMVWGELEKPLEEMLSADNLKMIIPETDSGCHIDGKRQVEGLLLRLKIPAEHKQPMLRQLDTVGINEKSLFPGLDGIGKYVERKYRFDYCEALNAL